jgi:hypothetical protein
MAPGMTATDPITSVIANSANAANLRMASSFGSLSRSKDAAAADPTL